MQDVLAKLKEIQENYDNEDIQRAIAAAEKTAVVEEETVEEETVEEATDEVVDEAEETVEEDSVEEVHDEEVVEESVNNSDLERMIRLAGRSGVLGMSKPSVIVNESVEVEEAMHDDDEDEDEEDEIEEGSGDAPEYADADADDKRWDDAEEEEDEEGDVDMEETVEVPVHALQELMRLAGYEEYKIDEYANEPEENYSSAEDQMDLGGGLNGPKKAYAAAAGGDNPMQQEPTEIEEESKLTFEGMYKRYMQEVVNETLEDKE